MPDLLEWQPLIAAFINAVIAISLAIWVSYGLTAAMKRTEFFLDFTKRYHAILVEAHKLYNKIKTEPSPLDKGDAHQIYFQLFGLMYDEIHAYQNNFLDKEVLVEWMTWQMYEFRGGKFKIGEVSYQDGWKEWLDTPAEHHKSTSIMKQIFACSDGDCIRCIIRALSGRWTSVVRRK